jgi:hypothetical protein
MTHANPAFSISLAKKHHAAHHVANPQKPMDMQASRCLLEDERASPQVALCALSTDDAQPL